MNKYFSIIVSDLKNTRRDPTLLLIFWVPFLILGIVRFGLPVLLNYLPVVSGFSKEIVVLFALLNALFPGFILAFIILDEKDTGILPVIKVTPVSLTGFLEARILFMIIFGLLGSLILLIFSGLIKFSIIEILGICTLSALNVPIIVLIIATFAKNKIEGLTLLKVANIIVFVPVILFFVNNPYENLLGIFPAFWVFKFIDSGNSAVVFMLGVIVLLSINYQTYQYAIKRLH